MPRKIIGSLLVGLIVALMGCASDQAHRYYASEKYPAKDTEAVDLLFEQPRRQFVVIADFQSRGETPNDMRKRAAEIGADAVIVSLLGGEVSISNQWAGKDKNTSYSRITGTAIKYK